MNKIEIDLSPKDEESFEKNDQNIVKVKIQLPTGEWIDSGAYRVVLSLSKDAMLGIAINLLRAVYGDESRTNFWHLYPSEPDFAIQSLGVYLHPLSCQFLISEQDFGTLEDLLKST